MDRDYSGKTNPLQHRRRRTLLLAGLAAACLAVALAVVVAAHALLGGGVRGEDELKPEDDAVHSGVSVLSDTLDGEGEADEPEPAPATLRLVAIGDMLMHEGVIESGNQGDGTYRYDHLFAHIADDVAAADVAALNQETILGGSAWPYSGYPIFNSPQALGDTEAEFGFDVILKATNHTLDLGYDGVRSELAFWRERHPEMAVIGAADPDGSGICPAGGTSAAGAYIAEKDGLKVALLNYTDVLNANIDASYDPYVVSILTEEGLRSDVAAAREHGADAVVVFVHWGDEYVTTPTERERWWAGQMQDAGVDVIVGGHPHVIQPVEVLGEGESQTLVFWSFGNFVSTQTGAANMVGGLVTVDFEKDEAGTRIAHYEFCPTITQREGWSTNMTAYPLRDYTDELAATSTLTLTDPYEGYSQAWYIDYCADVLGDAFDYETLTVHGSLA